MSFVNHRSLEDLSELLVALKQKMKPLEEQESSLKSELYSYSGKSHITRDGFKVQVTRATSAKAVGFEYVIDEHRLCTLDGPTRARLEELGVVKLQPKMTRGASPKVRIIPVI